MCDRTSLDKDLMQLAESFDLATFLKVTGITTQDLEADSKFYAQEQTKVESPKAHNTSYFLRPRAAPLPSEQNVNATPNLNRTR